MYVSIRHYIKHYGSIIDTTALPARPGYDLLTRMLFNDNYVKDIVVKAVIEKGICGDAQYVGSEERHDGRRNDVVYYPLATPSEELRSVIMEIQMNVTKEFVSYVLTKLFKMFERQIKGMKDKTEDNTRGYTLVVGKYNFRL
ncbi:uncharacterized protein EV154DRAFT_486750 [Mucor mucedo]|uniref:uncharacterized protein n=1 Tax=Mucor mucedo TaxID=29922 RepID=UPI00221F5969|nr:uncharacterized protein EV154DRAFT_486750 [Mucor mucedo]KAI7875366.1 hypothetical protein EV154DRAFT_486750 [Mucor mucedo]